jgi:hypothetical protein
VGRNPGPGRRSLAMLLLAGCGSGAVAGPRPAAPLAAAESLYLELRDVRDRMDVAGSAARDTASNGTPVTSLAARHHELRRAVTGRMELVDATTLSPEDRRALSTMRRALGRELAPVSGAAGPAQPAGRPPDCDYGPAAIARGPGGADSLRARIYACFAWAQHQVAVGDDTLDRLSVYGELAREADRERRRRLFLALDPVWRSINRDNDAGSPYRKLIALEAAAARGASAPAREARLGGIPPDSLEPWLIAILETWRAAAPDAVIEPWDWYYLAGRPARELGSRVTRERLRALTAAVYRALGADLAALNVRYDLEPRAGKSPVAFCTFGARPRFVGGRWTPGEPSVFATYRAGGLDNLAELLHETGHAIHIAAIRTRPAFTDWPDSDPFSEAVADFVALDVGEPAWQQRWLGDSVPLGDGLRARYGGIVLDVAWSLFELRMLREPSADPNAVWTGLTSRYLRIRPHPELSWWAMRGQLVDSPGYMMNYAVGAILIAALRARTVERHGPWLLGDPGWYPWVSRMLFRYGLERSTREVVEEFLGGPATPAALLADMGRMKR